MCYSAEASFIASGVLAGTGIAISRLPKEKSGLSLSLIPAIFATHQLIEGFIWLNQGDPEPGAFEQQAIFAYMLIAYVLWPIFIPYAAYRVEREKWRRVLILVCQGVGLSVGLGYFIAMVRGPIGVSEDCCNLSYQIQAPGILGALYLLAVSVPFILSSRKGQPLFGLAVVASCAAAFYLASLPGVPSVWCFFAAFLSASLYVYFRAEARSFAHQPRDTAYSGPMVH